MDIEIKVFRFHRIPAECLGTVHPVGRTGEMAVTPFGYATQSLGSCALTSESNSRLNVVHVKNGQGRAVS